MVDFSKYKIKEESKKVPEVKIPPDKKIVPGNNKVAHSGKKVPKSNLTVENLPEEKKTKTEKIVDHIDGQSIDQKINEIINERLLNLVKLGLVHELTVDNMRQYFREVDRAKLYELKRYFSGSPGYKIEKILKILYTSGELKKDKDNWYSLKK